MMKKRNVYTPTCLSDCLLIRLHRSKIGPYGSPLLQEKSRDKMGLTAQVALSCNDGNDPQLL